MQILGDCPETCRARIRRRYFYQAWQNTSLRCIRGNCELQTDCLQFLPDMPRTSRPRIRPKKIQHRKDHTASLYFAKNNYPASIAGKCSPLFCRCSCQVYNLRTLVLRIFVMLCPRGKPSMTWPQVSAYAFQDGTPGIHLHQASLRKNRLHIRSTLLIPDSLQRSLLCILHTPLRRKRY